MHQQLRQHIIQKVGYEPPHLNRVLDNFQPYITRRNEPLIEVGTVCRKVFFIAEGCLKTTTYNRNGDETTTDIAFEHQWRTAMRSFVNQHPSNERLVAVEKSKLLVIQQHNFVSLCKEVPLFEHLYKILLEASYTKSIERIQTLMSMDALDRLRWLLDQHPMIFTRLSNRLIASYLGLKPATLSRLKAKL